VTAQLQPPSSSNDDEKNLTILEHLQELRRRLMICGAAIFISLFVSFYPLTQWFVVWLKKPAGKDFTLIFTEPLGLWTTFFQVSLQLAIAISMPVLVWQTLAFVGPGLTRNEKRWAYPIVFGASAMFILGCLFAYYVEMPPALHFLFNAPGDLAKPFISFKSYVSFATRLMMVTGLVFETPLIVMGLAKVGVVRSRQLIGWWRFVIVGAFIISAIVTPSIDPVTQTLVAVPMIVLFFIGIGLARLVEGNPLIPHS
jgi:sec-independent protein translocase protein TatC